LRRLPLVSAGVPSRPRVPALRLRARDVRARYDEELPPDCAILVLSADRSGRRISLDRARARTPEELALGLACPPCEPDGAGGHAPGLLGARTAALLHAESVEAAAVPVAADAARCACRRSAADARDERTGGGRRNRSRKTHLRGDRGTVRHRAGVPDHLAPRADQPDAGRAGRDPTDRTGAGNRVADLGGVGLVRGASGAPASCSRRDGICAHRDGDADRVGAAPYGGRRGPLISDDRARHSERSADGCRAGGGWGCCVPDVPAVLSATPGTPPVGGRSRDWPPTPATGARPADAPSDTRGPERARGAPRSWTSRPATSRSRVRTARSGWSATARSTTRPTCAAKRAPGATRSARTATSRRSCRTTTGLGRTPSRAS